MQTTQIKEIGRKLKNGANLKFKPLCIYGSEYPPQEGVKSTEIHFCIANAILSLAASDKTDIIYFNMENKRGSCPGSRAWLGYEEFNPFLKNFLSTGIKNYPAEYLVATPEIADKRLKSLGKLKPLGTNTVFQKTYSLTESEDIKISAILLFGRAEKIRNLSMLGYFTSHSATGKIEMPWGSSCASFVTYPAGLAEKGPKDAIILGPMDPTDNYFFPPDILAMGIPINLAVEMAENVEKSFLIKRTSVAFPEERADPNRLYDKKDFKKFSEKLFKH